MKQSWTTLGTYNVEGGEALLSEGDQKQLRLDLPAGYAILEVRTFNTATQVRLARVASTETDDS